MSVQLKLDEMTEALRICEHPLAAELTAMAEALGTLLSGALAAHLDIIGGEATDQGSGFAGICAPFQPKWRGQPFPEAFEGFDNDSEWEADSDDLPPPPASSSS
jgi:hypothetical protein